MSLQNLINAIKIVEAVQRIPPKLEGIPFFGENDYWDFHAILDGRVCIACEELEPVDKFKGSSLRRYFPYLEIVDENTIKANVHPNCRCWLSRVWERKLEQP